MIANERREMGIGSIAAVQRGALVSTDTPAHVPSLWAVFLRLTSFTACKPTVYTQPFTVCQNPASSFIFFSFSLLLPFPEYTLTFFTARHKSVTQTLSCPFTTGFPPSPPLVFQSFLSGCYFIFLFSLPQHFLDTLHDSCSSSHTIFLMCVFPIHLIPALIKFCVSCMNTHIEQKPSPSLL